MTVGQEQVKILMEYKIKMRELMSQIDEAEDSLLGMELRYKGKYASIEYVDANSQNASLYVEDEEGNHDSIYVPLQELHELLG